MGSIRVKAITGIYEGYQDIDGVNHFLGIPYVQTPKRWQPAKALQPSDAVISAKQYGPACYQDWAPEEFDTEPAMSEDCLSLNIWMANPEQKGKTVMVWIHGGANATGSNGMNCCHGTYCGDLFVKDNPEIIFVNINYRLNVFGSMDFSSIDINGEYKDSNNLQTLDQIAALRWIYENIGAFGGDAENITIFGQSAGAYSVSTLMLIPAATKYFKQAICESCAVDETLKTREQARYIGQKFIDLTGVKSMAECLLLTPEEIIRTVPEIMQNPICPAFCGMRDGKLIPEDIYGTLQNGSASHVKVMLGTTSGEYDTMSDFVSDEDILEMARDSYPGEITDEMVEAYMQNEPDRDQTTALKDIFNDSMRLTVIALADALYAGGSEVYMYYINCMDEKDVIRPQHCYEIPFITGRKDTMVYMSNAVPEPVQGRTPTLERQIRFQKTWAAFAKNGNPNNEQLVMPWRPYTTKDRQTMVMGQNWQLVNGVRNKDTALLMAAAIYKK